MNSSGIRARILVVLECVSYDAPESLICALAAKAPLDKTPWINVELAGMHLKQSSMRDVRELRAAVVRSIARLVRSGRIIETEPGRYALPAKARRAGE